MIETVEEVDYIAVAEEVMWEALAVVVQLLVEGKTGVEVLEEEETKDHYYH
jgi:hypothetical protein